MSSKEPDKTTLQLGKVYHCADGEDRLLLREDESFLAYAIYDTGGAWREMRPTHKGYILKSFLNGSINEAASELTREVF